MSRRGALLIFFSLASALAGVVARADGPLAAEAEACAKAEKAGVPAALLVDPSPASVTKTSAGERLLAFAKWVEDEEAGPLSRDGKIMIGHAASAAPYAAAGMKVGEGGLAVLDYQGGLVTVVPPSENIGTWKHAFEKAIARAVAVGDAKKKRVKEIERDEAAMQADLKAGETAAAIKLGLPIETDTSVRCDALDRVKKTMQDLHDKAIAIIKTIDDERDQATHQQQPGAGGRPTSRAQAMSDWANHTLASVRQIRKLYGAFKDVNNLASDREALATRTLQGQ